MKPAISTNYRVFEETYLQKCRPKWWDIRGRIKTRRFAKRVKELLASDTFAFNGDRESFRMWDDRPPSSEDWVMWVIHNKPKTATQSQSGARRD